MKALRHSSLVAVFLLTATANVVADPTGGVNPPEFQQWEADMITYGNQLGTFLNPATGKSGSETLNAQYYDAQWVFYQIADYTGNQQPWYTYGGYAEARYRDEHLRATNFKTQGYRRFPHGLYEDWRRNGDTTIADLVAIRDNPAYSNLSELSGNNGRRGFYESISREVAYAVSSNITAEKAGEPRRIENGTPRLQRFVEFMENHLWEWRNQTYESSGGGRTAPFMFGLTAYSLIEFYEWERDQGRDPDAYWPTQHWPDIPTALEAVATWMRDSALVASGSNAGKRMYIADYNGSGYAVFRYEDIGSANPSPDLNQLIAPVYYWLYKETGKSGFLHTGDELFGAAVRFGYLVGGKQFNQQYRLVFRSLEWRRDGGIRPKAPTGLTVN